MDSTAFLVIALIAIAFLSLVIFLALFEPTLPYKITRAPRGSLKSDQFQCVLEAISDAHIGKHTKVEVFTNGENFYPAELAAIRQATHSVHLEAYIFQRGRVTREFVDALTERARNGIQVRLLMDAIGSFATWNSYFKDLCDAGGEIGWYHPFRWHTLPRINNRTHREIIVIDGKVGFVGGAGFADHWLHHQGKAHRWRDTMFRVEGAVIGSLQSTFIENWLEATGELLAEEDFFPPCEEEQAGSSSALIINSSPSAGQATRARMLYQTLLASAKKSIHITTPYFLPDESARKEMVYAIRERGVDVQIIVPGKHADHLLTRRSSRRLYGDLLKAGARIYEYKRSMIHTKSLVIDGVWSVVGSTNFDHRSFGLNDEVNLAVLDERVAARVLEDFSRDRVESEAITYAQWRRRPVFERVHEWFGWLLERQQ